MTYIDNRWSAAPAAMAAALAILGHPAYAADGAQQDARVAAWGPVRLDTVAGRAVMFALIRTTSPIDPPAGVYAEPGAISEAATGAFMGAARSATNTQIRAVLLNTPVGETTLFALVDAWTVAQGGAVRQAWEYANEFTRDGAMVAAAAATFGLSEQDLDAMFTAAAAINF